ncbi:CGNR zinc finger domain-containing protein [Streptomyces sp. A7024]|uniref:CGNR zinc finger domain-containing protein n=1 Tax=Streptomyces coryli TaxID=1128680 RepID=A0A6G4UCJ5_9ACTN|nr:CGNR zinc finger domain-containing protein [Streptomyces coryli]NGN69396.1 CGNR zinc finger domain-containing protein [Streptomyces coryli]
MTTDGFRPAQRILDLANAVREDPAIDRAGLAAVLAEHGETPADLADFTDAAARELRAAIIRLTEDVLAEPDPDRAARALNAVFEESGARPRLTRHGGRSPWHLHTDRGDDAGWADWLLASSALALAQIFTEHGRPAWGECAAQDCTRLFLGTGPGAPRRYCSTRCASRTRVAAHRRRQG